MAGKIIDLRREGEGLEGLKAPLLTTPTS